MQLSLKRIWGIDKTTLLVVSLTMLSLLLGCSDSDHQDKMFENVTLSSGLGSYVGMTHGAAWGDYDSDGLPDLYVTNHLKKARLFRNLGTGSFSDATDAVLSLEDTGGDKHGAAWSDFNNDGRLDLVQLTGAGRGVGSEPKLLLRNDENKFTEVAETFGVANPYGRTRMPLWMDIDRDGKLDLFQGAEARFDKRVPTFFFRQGIEGGFTAADDVVSFALNSVPFCIISELTNDAYPELICRVTGNGRTAQIFDTATVPTHELDLLPITAFEDIAAGDFNNDGSIDLFLARTNYPGPIAVGQPGSNELMVDLSIPIKDGGESVGFTFESSGEVEIQIADMLPPRALSAEDINIGKNGRHPDSFNFTLSSETSEINGMQAYEPAAQASVYIGLIAPGKWQIQVSPAMKGKPAQQIAINVAGSEPITELELIGSPLQSEAAPARLFMNRDGTLVEESEQRGVNEQPVSGVNVVSGDFDNDMDLDLFVLASGLIGKHENLLLLNRGDGKFDVAPAAGGAAGFRSGVGDSVTTADFDRDGFLDLLTSTGGSMGRSLGLPSDTGAYQLYRNLGNENNWLEIDLNGTISNRDGIGSRVTVSAGGVKQIRIQDGGIHHRSQNHSRLHFGLGKNVLAKKITVQWPSGIIQELENVDANHVINIHEPSVAADNTNDGPMNIIRNISQKENSKPTISRSTG